MILKNIDVVVALERFAATFLSEAMKDKYLPVKLNFIIQKNLSILASHNMVIDNSRKKICEHYGTIDNDHYIFSDDVVDIVNSELQELQNVEVDLPILTIALSSIEDLELTPSQMEAIMFMIEE